MTFRAQLKSVNKSDLSETTRVDSGALESTFGIEFGQFRAIFEDFDRNHPFPQGVEVFGLDKLKCSPEAV